jgi:2-polyprenyl-6-methoxyphenol hydroxylase-like FAD-dependent oxidoreductase
MGSAVVIGGGVAGLGAALGLAQSGHEVVVLERDGPTDATSPAEAFSRWDRPNVPQFRQPHTVLARARNLLIERAPQVVDRLQADGIDEINFIHRFTPPEEWEPEDDALTSLITRRPAFELALRREVEGRTTIDLRCDQTATGLSTSVTPSGPVVDGVCVDSEVLDADVVIDAGGRRTAVPRWLADVGVDIPHRSQDCQLTYHSRHYVLRDTSSLDHSFLALLRSEIHGMGTITFPGEHRTFALCLCPATWETELKVLRHTWAWEAAIAVMPGLARWVDPEHVEPLGDVVTMAGHTNVVRDYVVDGRPLAPGVLPVGDALCATNPNNAWGISMGLTTAFAAVDAVEAGEGDPVRTSVRYHEGVNQEVEEVYTESAAIDRAREYRWRHIEPPEHFREEYERQLLTSELQRAAMRGDDREMARRLLRRVNLIDSPRRTLDEPGLADHLRDLRNARAPDRRSNAPTRDDVLAAIAAASD